MAAPLENECEDNWCWNIDEKSPDVSLIGTQHRRALFHSTWSNGTAGVRGTRILNGGRYYWEINISERIFGTSMMIGIGTKDSKVHDESFINLLGENDQSWGLSHKGTLWHNGSYSLYTKPFTPEVSTTLGIYFDGVLGTLTYYKDSLSLGVAFRNLEKIKKPLYPMISSTAAKTEMSLGATRREYTSLMDRCRVILLRHPSSLIRTQLPPLLSSFILEDEKPSSKKTKMFSEES